MAASAAYDPDVDGRVVAKYPAKLRHGEHVLKRRFVIAEDETQIRFIYSHHGIYDKQKGYVIQFGNSEHSVLGSPYKEGTLLGAGGTRSASLFGAIIANVLLYVKRACADFALEVAGNAIMAGCDTEVFASELNYFRNDNGTVLVWEYATRTRTGAATQADGENPGHGVTATAIHGDRNGEAAVAIARWFARHPSVFGSYHLGRWNCEHFASFCKTTDLGVGELEEMKHDAGDADAPAALCRQTLVARSRSRSIQIERLHADWGRAVATESAHPDMASNGDSQGRSEISPSQSPSSLCGTTQAQGPSGAIIGNAGKSTSNTPAAAAASRLVERLLVHNYHPSSGDIEL